MKIRTIFICSLIFFSLSSLIVYTVYCAASMNYSATAQYELLYSNIAKNESTVIARYVNNLVSTVSVVANDPELESVSLADSDSVSSALEQAENYIGDETDIVRIALLNASNQLAACTDSDYQLTFSDEQLEQLIQGEAYVSTVLENGKVIGYELAVPFTLNSSASMIAYFSDSSLSEIIKSGLFPTNGHIIFVDSLGNLIDSAYVGLLSEISHAEYSAIKDVILNDNSNLGTSVSFEVGNNARLCYTVKSSECGWYVSAMAEADMAFTYSSSALGGIVTLVVVMSLLAIAIYIIVIFVITKPLSEIEDTLVHISRGDHDSRVEVNTKNEYGEISMEFNLLLDNVIISERRYRTIVEMSDDIVFEWNMKSNNVTFSNNFNKKFSYRAPSDHFSDSFFLKGKLFPEDSERYHADLARLEKGEEFKDNQYRWKNVYGDYVWMSMKTATIRDSDGNVVKIIGVLSDVDREKRNELQLIKRASYDALTGVYNRETIENVISNEIQNLSEGGDGFAILFVDIDDFKHYNDKFSHATGDQVLKFVTSSIGEIVEDFGFIGRYGGDEFIVCVRNASTNVPQRVAQDMLAKFKEGFVCDNDVHLSVSASIGIYIVTNTNKTVDEIISIADDAMYEIKKNGKSLYNVVS